MTDPQLSEREKGTLLARLAEHAERYDEMAEYMKQVVVQTPELSLEERNLFSVAYKNVIGTRRASWRLVETLLNELNEKLKVSAGAESSSGEQAPKAQPTDLKHDIEIVEPFKRKIESELTSICRQVLDLLTEQLIPHATDVEERVFYFKMVGDYFRYMSEFSVGEEKKTSAGGAYDNYRQATEIARESLSATHPLRLGLALNFSVFYYEVLGSAHRACLLAKQAFDDAIPELDSLPDELYHDSKLIMKLLRDNLTFWQNEAGQTETVDEVDREVSPTS